MALLDKVTGAVFFLLSRLRGTRVFHPDGVVFEATWRTAPGGQRLLPPGEHAALVRLSRGIGLPRTLPDVLGVAVRVLHAHGPDRDQDLLLASVGRGRLGRRVLVPGQDFSDRTFSSLLAYATDRDRALVTAQVDVPAGTSLASLRNAPVVDGEIRVSLGRHGELGRLRLGDRLSRQADRDLRFDPWHTGEGLRPVGRLNRLRRPTYQASQSARGAAPEGAHGHPAPRP